MPLRRRSHRPFGEGAPAAQIQRPDFADRLRGFLGIRGAMPITEVSPVLQPVVVVGDINQPMVGLKTRRRCIQGGGDFSVGASQIGMALSAPSSRPFIRVYPRELRIYWSNTAGTADTFWQVSLHPVPITIPGLRMDPGYGGDNNSSVRSGINTLADSSALNPQNLSYVVKHQQETVIPLDGWVLTPEIPVGAAGGPGASLIFGITAAISGSLNYIFQWEEEDVGSS